MTGQNEKTSFMSAWTKNYKAYKYIYWMLIPVLLYYTVFHYFPMFGAIIAFQDYKPAFGFFESEWVGLENFIKFFESPYAWRVIRNTLSINIAQILFGFPAPILLALMINEVRVKVFKVSVQTASYMPYFISMVVVCGLLADFSNSNGIFGSLATYFGMEPTNLLSVPEYFQPIYVISGIWQNVGWGSIIYLATLSNVDPCLHEAAAIDGAGRLRRIIHISFPALLPVIIIQLIMRMGNILTQGFEKVILLYNPLTYETADIISSFLYREGLLRADYSYGAAVGIFNSVVNIIILITVNKTFRKTSGESLW